MNKKEIIKKVNDIYDIINKAKNNEIDTWELYESLDFISCKLFDIIKLIGVKK